MSDEHEDDLPASEEQRGRGRPRLTEEQRRLRREQLARGRETAKRNREAKAAEIAARGDDEHLLQQPALPIDDEDVGQNDTLSEQRRERRERLLRGIPEEIAESITDDELDALEAKHQADAKAERRKQALASISAELKHRARAENDLIEASALRSEAERKFIGQPVTFRINLPLEGSGRPERGPVGIRVNGYFYEQGQTYTRPLAVAQSLFDTHYRAWRDQIRFETLDQHKPGRDALTLVGQRIPDFYVEA